MAKKKLITLAKELDFKTAGEYFDYMIDTHINGQFSQCKNLFDAMCKDDQKEFILYLKYYNNSGEMKDIEKYYFNLL